MSWNICKMFVDPWLKTQYKNSNNRSNPIKIGTGLWSMLSVMEFYYQFIICWNWRWESVSLWDIKYLLRDLKVCLTLSDDNFRLLLSLVNFAIVSFLMGDWRPQIPKEAIRPFKLFSQLGFSTVILKVLSSVQSLSHIWLCDPMNLSTPGFPVHHQLLELAQTLVHQVSDAIWRS